MGGGEEARYCVLRETGRDRGGGALTRYRAHLGKGGRAGEGERKVGEVGEQDEHHPVRGDEERPFSAGASNEQRVASMSMSIDAWSARVR